MKLSEFKQKLNNIEQLHFSLSNGEQLPQHFHITEIGKINKKFIDCGGVFREENIVNFQIWVANDLEHRLSPKKLLSIIEISKSILQDEDLEIEVEYQLETIGKFGLMEQNGNFILIPKMTNCLAQDHCGIPKEKIKLSLAELQNLNSKCEPNSGCCN